MKNSLLYQNICCAFCVIVILSNIISVKLVPLPYFNAYFVPAGLFIYPVSFLLTALVTELYGTKKAQKMIFVTLGMNILALFILQFSLFLPSRSEEEHRTYQTILGLGGVRIASSLIAYTLSQLLDIQIYATIKKWSQLRFLWLRINGSTWTSQLMDTVLIDLIYLGWAMKMQLSQIFPIIAISFAYKILFSLILTPIFYLFAFGIKKRASD